MQITQYGNVDLNVQFKIYAEDLHNANSEQLNHFMFKYLTQFCSTNNYNVSEFEYKVLSTLLNEVGSKYKYLFDKNNANVLSEYIEKHNGYVQIDVNINLNNIEVNKYAYSADVQLVDDKIINVNKISLYNDNDNDKLSTYATSDLSVKLKQILFTNLDDNFYIADLKIENKSNFDNENSLIANKKEQLLGKVL